MERSFRVLSLLGPIYEKQNFSQPISAG
jgi:hypothetical protein